MTCQNIKTMFTDAKDPEYQREQFCIKCCAYKDTCETACLIVSETVSPYKGN